MDEFGLWLFPQTPRLTWSSHIVDCTASNARIVRESIMNNNIVAYACMLNMVSSYQAQGLPYPTYHQHDEATNVGGLRLEKMSNASMIWLLVAPFLGLALFCLAAAFQSYYYDDDEYAETQTTNSCQSQNSVKHNQADVKGPIILEYDGIGYKLLGDDDSEQ